MASERIREAIVAAQRHGLPVVASMGNVAASGGYWVATPANAIFAEPSTITGSIGVFGILPSFEGSLAKLGVGLDGIKTTPLSGEPDLLGGPSPEADALIQAGVESIYRRFLGLVAASRKKSPAEIDRIAQGRVWDGGTARQLGLVDQFGGLDEAIAKAAQLAKIDDRGVTYLEEPPSFEERLADHARGRRGSRRRPAGRLRVARPGPGEFARARAGRSVDDPRRAKRAGALPRMPALADCRAHSRDRPGGGLARLVQSGLIRDSALGRHRQQHQRHHTIASEKKANAMIHGLCVSSRSRRSMMWSPHMKS